MDKICELIYRPARRKMQANPDVRREFATECAANQLQRCHDFSRGTVLILSNEFHQPMIFAADGGKRVRAGQPVIKKLFHFSKIFNCALAGSCGY
jgi:hypothetical protein